MEITRKVVLPSNGMLYPIKEVTIKPMTSNDFDIINDSTDLSFVYQVIQNSIVEPKDLNILNLNPYDVDAILFALRNLSIGPSYEQNAICPFCHTPQHVVIDIDSFDTITLDKKPETKVTLPNGDIVEFQPLTEQMQKDALQDSGMDKTKFSLLKTLGMIKQVSLKFPIITEKEMTVETIKTRFQIEDWLNKLSYIDRLFLQQAMVIDSFGLDTSIKVQCENSSCQNEFTVVGGIDGVSAPEFFRPILFKK